MPQNDGGMGEVPVETEGMLWRQLAAWLRRRWFVIAGGVALAVVVVFGAALAYAAFVLWPGARAYADETIPSIFTAWDTQQLSAHSSPELSRAAPPAQTEQLFRNLSSRLGRMTEYKGVRAGNVTNNLGRPATGWVLAEAAYEHGPATIRIELIRRNDAWHLTSWTVNSPALLPAAPKPTPPPIS